MNSDCYAQFGVAGKRLAFAPSFAIAQKKPFDAAAMLKIQRVADPQLSPDGNTVAFAVRARPTWTANKSMHSVWSVPLDDGPRQCSAPTRRPRRSPPLVARRKADLLRLNCQRRVADLEHERRWHRCAAQVARLSTEADGEIVSPDGKYLVVTSNVLSGLQQRHGGSSTRPAIRSTSTRRSKARSKRG